MQGHGYGIGRQALLDLLLERPLDLGVRCGSSATCSTARSYLTPI
jgi:hypothetical protein